MYMGATSVMQFVINKKMWLIIGIATLLKNK